MEFMFLIPFVIFAVLGAVGFFWGRWYAKQNAKRLAQIEATPMTKAVGVAKHAQKMAKMTGRIIAPGGTLTSPIEELECVYYRLLVDEQRTRVTRDSKGNRRTVTEWVTVVDAAKMVPCGIEDSGGAIEVSLAEADMLLRDGKQQESGWFSDVSPEIREMIDEEYGRETQGSFWAGQKTLRVREQVLAVGDTALVVGKVKLVRTNLGVRPRFVKGKEPLLVTDKDDAGLRGHFAWAAWWGNAAFYGGGGVGALALAGLLLLGGWLSINRLMGTNSGGGAVQKDDKANKILAAMKSKKEWDRARAIEGLYNGPTDEFAQRKADLKSALWAAMDDPSRHVVKNAAKAMPHWAEPGDVEQLYAWLDDQRQGEIGFEVRKGAAIALGKQKDAKGLSMMKERFAKMPGEMAAGLQEYGKGSTAFFASALKDPKARNGHRAALDALVKVGDEEACAALCTCFTTGHLWREAARKLKKLGPPADAALRAYLTTRAYGTNTNAAMEACRALQEVGTPASLPILDKLANQRGPDRAAKAAAAAIRRRNK